jgi:P27 family predicted phage terminase small subunit
VGERGPLRKADPKGNRTRADLAAREPVAEPVEAVEVPEPPAGLSATTLELWDGLWRSPVARLLDQTADMGVVRRWITAVEDLETARRIIGREGVTVLGSSGTPVLSPTARWAQSLEQTIGRLEKELGLTPQSRARLGLTIATGQLTAAQINAMAGAAPPALPAPADRGDDEEPEDGEWAEA